MKKKKTPNQLERNIERMKTFLNMKKNESSGILDNKVQYELKLDAHEKCTAKDIIEAVDTNFIGAIDEANIWKKYSNLSREQ